MSKTESVALIALILILIAMPAGFYIYDNFLKMARATAQPTEVVVFGWTPENGGWQPNTIVLKNGVKTKIVVIAMDTTHSLIIPDFNIDTGPINPGHRKEIEFTPTMKGIFTFFCGTVCSAEHHYMTGTLIVEG